LYYLYRPDDKQFLKYYLIRKKEKEHTSLDTIYYATFVPLPIQHTVKFLRRRRSSSQRDDTIMKTIGTGKALIIIETKYRYIRLSSVISIYITL
jgi:hypothetical protein